MAPVEKEEQRLARLVGHFRVEPGSKVRLPRDFDPAFTAGYVKESDAGAILAHGVAQLADLQDRLAAQDVHGLLVVLQAMDAAGKDGTIKHVMSGVNPQGVSVHSFKVPSTEELSHDYLWRYVRLLPSRGQIGIFNRSYYEEVLVVRVHPENLDRQRLPSEARGKDVWERRYREINDLERYLVDNGIHVVKLFLNVSNEEQRRRLLARVDLAEKNWKFSAADARERAFWDDYQHAYAEALTHTSTSWAPWYVIPADHKWFARLAVVAILVNHLRRIDPRYPRLGEAELRELQTARAQLEAEAPGTTD
jgi:PPK2 family polyphosphate:nucleotide phosphotransferase